MKRALIATCLAVTCMISLAAQTTPKEQSKAADPAAKQVTLQGCLQAGEQPNSFVLADVMKPEPKSGEPAPTGTAGATDAEISALKGTKLRLIGSPAGIKLAEHVGHTVEVTGALAPKDTKASPKPAEPAGTSSAADMRRLNLKSMKHIATTCTAR